ncbi:hypothetical protein [Aminivibrio sp.]|jgi:hypothetical protein|uniref:hypothetical protein n=1 Tax=Aminivibrio sp. TaxID=1872489 RepID=UPI003D95B55D
MKWKSQFYSVRLVVLAALLFAGILYPSGPAQGWDVFASSPWLAMVTRFIGGVYVSVKPVQEWNSDGETVRRIRQKDIPKGAKIIALDEAEASALGLRKNSYKNLFLLYNKVPFDRERADFFFSDPSVLPFIAQRVLTALSQFDSPNYAYFQRRLSEFQTRLDSTVLVGRQLLGGYPVFDLTGGFNSLLSAAGCEILPRDRGRREQWEKGEDMAGLVSQAGEAIKSMIPVVLDGSTAKAIRNTLKGNKNILFLSRPNPNQDLLLFFHDQFLLLWNRLALLREKQAAASSTKKK